MADRRKTRRQPEVTCAVCGRRAKLHEYVPAWGVVVRKAYHADDHTPAGPERCGAAPADRP